MNINSILLLHTWQIFIILNVSPVSKPYLSEVAFLLLWTFHSYEVKKKILSIDIQTKKIRDPKMTLGALLFINKGKVQQKIERIACLHKLVISPLQMWILAPFWNHSILGRVIKLSSWDFPEYSTAEACSRCFQVHFVLRCFLSFEDKYRCAFEGGGGLRQCGLNLWNLFFSFFFFFLVIEI